MKLLRGGRKPSPKIRRIWGQGSETGLSGKKGCGFKLESGGSVLGGRGGGGGGCRKRDFAGGVLNKKKKKEATWGYDGEVNPLGWAKGSLGGKFRVRAGS